MREIEVLPRYPHISQNPRYLGYIRLFLANGQKAGSGLLQNVDCIVLGKPNSFDGKRG